MKKNLYLTAVLAALLSVALYSCNDDEKGGEPLTKTEAEALANAVYGPLQTLSSSYSFLLESATEVAISFEDDAQYGDAAPGPQVSRFETIPGNWYAQKVFGKLYVSIGAANLAIEKISADTGLAQADKDLLVARARFIRGYDYFQLVQLYGEVPLILTPGSTEKSRASIDNVYEQIVTDLTAAVSGLPEYDDQKSNPTKLAAYTILAKAYLTWGQKSITAAEISSISGQNDPVKPAPDNTKLAQAVEYADLVINSGRYQLKTNFNDIWDVRNENNSEVIFSIQHYGDAIDAQGNHQTHCGYTWPGEARRDPHISYADSTLVNRIPEGDARRAFSYTTEVKYVTAEVVDTLRWPISIVRPGKWIHREIDGRVYNTNVQTNDIDHIDFRLAEVLLIKAEALFFQGRANDALPLVNQLRERAFGNTEHNLSTLTVEDLYNEWDDEFAFEQKHWVNLVRWRTLLSTVKNTVPYYEYYKEEYRDSASITAAYLGVSNINLSFYSKVYSHLHAKIDNLHGRLYRFPIPLGLTSEDLGITPQNPGY